MPSSGVQTCALRSEEHTSELQSHDNLGCRLLLEKKDLNAAAGPPAPHERGRAGGSAPGAAGASAPRGGGWAGASVPGRSGCGSWTTFFLMNGPPPESYPFSLPPPLPS